MSNFSFPVRDGKNRERKKKKTNFNFTSDPTSEESDLDDTAEGNSLSNS